MSVFHLKYRPRKIGDLDLVQVVDVLTNILKSKNVPQSLLFAGPKGAGKTSAARIFAQAINCTHLDGVEPCGKCQNCQEILKGNCLDVIEIDAASNRGIEEARDLKEKAYLLPSRLNKKVFIVDEVHMMTREAFNALLKLIEEPPVQTFFILCTTDEDKIPETILSRLVKISFQKGTKEELKKSLRRVTEGEGIKLDKKVVERIVDSSDGSFRNIQKTFNEIFLQYGKKIDEKEVEEFFASKWGDYKPEDMESDLIVGEIKVILDKIEKMAVRGTDFKRFRENLLLHFQNKMLGKCGVEGKGLTKMSLPSLEKWLQLLIGVGRTEKDVAIDQLPLELAVIEFLSSNNQEIPPGDSLRRATSKQSPTNNDQNKIEESKVEISEVDLGIGVEEIERNWAKILVAVKPFNHSVEAFLRAARPKSINGNLLTLEVFYPFHKDKLEEQKNRKIVEGGLVSVLGKEMVLKCVLGKSKRESLVIRNDTPEAMILQSGTDDLVENKNKSAGENIYDVAKEIFG